MNGTTFQIATLHRGKYMLFLLAGVCIVTAVVSKLSVQEVLKIIIVLLSVPGLIFLSTKWSKNYSTWSINNGTISIEFKKSTEKIDIKNIKYLRNVPRSGGNLIMIFQRDTQTPKRYWRNKLFQKVDDLDSLIHALRNEGIDYYYM